MSSPDSFDFSDRGWQQLYEQGRTGWDRGEPSPALIRWLDEGWLSPCRIFVPGCGRGHEVVELASRGFHVTAADFAKAPVTSLQNTLSARGLTATIHQSDVLTYTTDTPFDAVYEQTCLCAIHPNCRSTYEQRLFDCLAPGGQLCVLFMQIENSTDAAAGNGPPFHCDLHQMKQLFSELRWIWPQERLTVEHSAGRAEIGVLLQRKEP